MAEPVDLGIGVWIPNNVLTPVDVWIQWYHEPTDTYGFSDFSDGSSPVVGGYAPGDTETFLEATHQVKRPRGLYVENPWRSHR